MVTQVKPKALVIGNYRGRSGIIAALRGSAFEVIEATECLRSIKHVLEDSPNVILISAGAGRAGLLSQLRAIRCLTSVPILVIGTGCETSASEALFNGASGFVPQSRKLETTSVYVNALLSRN